MSETLFQDIKDIDSNLQKIDKTSYKNIGICHIGYITMKQTDGYENISSVIILYLLINKADGYIDETHGIKYLIFTSADKEVFTKDTKL